MSATCNGCGGVVGRDCWNPQECEWIMRDQAARYAALQYDPTPPEPCQGCHYVTGRMAECLGLCAGMTCQEDADARAALWAAIPQTLASQPNAERHRIAEAIAAESRHHYHAPDVRAALLTVSDRVRKGEL